MNNNDTSPIDLTAHTKLLAGKLCWAILSGPGTGSIISLQFGKKILRDEPVDNPFISADAREFDAEISLMIYCAWRIDSPTEVVCSSQSPNRRNGPMLQGLDRLVGVHVRSVDVRFPGNDLTMEFENGLVLRVFCDQADIEDNSNNYVLYEEHSIVSVSAGSKVVSEDWE